MSVSLARLLVALSLLLVFEHWRISRKHDRRRGRSLLEGLLGSRLSPLSMLMRKSADGRLAGWSNLRVLDAGAFVVWCNVVTRNGGLNHDAVVALLIILGAMPADTLCAAIPLRELFGALGAKAGQVVDAATDAIKTKFTAVVETAGRAVHATVDPGIPEVGKTEVVGATEDAAQAEYEGAPPGGG